MSISTSMSNDNKSVTISVSGRFDFSVHGEFRDAYNKAEAGVNEYIMNLQQTEYVDSSALGMMLLLKEHAEKNSATIRIVNATPDIKDILEIANFNKLFNIQ